jgi:TPR repeat protein
MEEQIINFINSKYQIYLNINNEDSIKKIYDLLINTKIFEPINAIENHYLGWYYCIINKNYDLVPKYYLMAIDLGNTISMVNLGNYYLKIDKNNDLAKKYYFMAINNGDAYGCHHLAHYYQFTEKNYDLMKEYYLLGINKNFILSMYNLADYYQHREINYKLMKKYYLMAINKNNMKSLSNLINYYNYNNLPIKKLKVLIKYSEKKEIINHINYIAKIKLNKKDKIKFINMIINFEDNDISSIIKILIKTIKYKINIIRLHFEYSLEGKGFEEAKNDFNNKII